MSPYLRLLDLLVAELEAEAARNELANDVELGAMALFLPDQPDPRAWFHSLFMQSRERGLLQPLRHLMQGLLPNQAPELQALWRLALSQAEASAAARTSDKEAVVDGQFDVILDSPLALLRLSQLDAWVAELSESRTVHSLRIVSIQAKPMRRGLCCQLRVAASSHDYVGLWAQVCSGQQPRLGPHWVLEVGSWRPDETACSFDPVDTLTSASPPPKRAQPGLLAQVGRVMGLFTGPSPSTSPALGAR